ncbi:integral membrane protein, DUF6 [Teredinibacter turnerae T7901]|uniref:Integral membrane protein, DUF6 n=1 Tax=Teredinibacter turnerae (strain ATCC 39867 / T7901) TaxID=377629 RepID=C5BKJ1_TERTT|nr:integral membrane protein, DUF6 [Teredinibacter turnerae T7901]
MFVLLACLCFSVMAVCVRKISTQLPLAELGFFRSIIPTIIVAAMIMQSRGAFFPAPRKPLLIRGVLGTGGLLCFFHATQHLPLSVSGILVWCTPVVTYVVARVFLKERLGLATLLWLGVALFGLTIIFTPVWLSEFSGDVAVHRYNLADFGIGLLGTLCAGAVFVAIRSAASNHNNNSIVLSFSVTASLITGVWMGFSYQQPTANEWGILLLMGIAGTLAQLALTEAYRNAPAALVSSMSLMQAPITIIWGVFLFAEQLSGYHLLGILVMGGGVIFASIAHSRG